MTRFHPYFSKGRNSGKGHNPDKKKKKKKKKKNVAYFFL